MPAHSDQQAADAALRAGARFRLEDEARIYALDPATGRWHRPQGIALRQPAPLCTACGGVVSWTGTPRTKGRWHLYPVGHWCLTAPPGADGEVAYIPDVIRWPGPLVMQGSLEWWQRWWDLGARRWWPLGWGEPPSWTNGARSGPP